MHATLVLLVVYVLDPNVGMYAVQGVFTYTDFGIWRRLEKPIASSDIRARQYNIPVTESTPKLKPGESKLFWGKAVVVAVSMSFLSSPFPIKS